MLGRNKSTFRAALFAGLAITAIATQLEPTKLPFINAIPQVNPESRDVVAENTRHVRPTPAALTRAINSTDPSFASGNQSPLPQKPIDITAALSDFSNTGARLTPPDRKEASDWVRVNRSVVNVRSGPRVSARRIGSFQKGTRLRVIERGTSWTKVEDPQSGQSGWMYRDYLASMSEGGEPAS